MKTMKKLCKKLTMLAITISGMMYSTLSFADGATKSTTGVDPTIFSSTSQTDATKSITTFGNNILSMVATAASVFAVVCLIVLGVKYMMGSAEEKAEYKKTLLPYFIGALFVFGAGAICSVLFGIAQTNWAA